MQLLCVGDIALANKNTSAQVWAPPGDLLPGDDSKILFNWELPIGETLNSRPRASGPRLLAYTNSSNVLRKWAPGFAALATNHILDGDSESLLKTIISLQQEGFTTFGAGQSLNEVSKPLFWETAEGVLAIVNWVFPETQPDWMVVPGPNCWPGLQEAKKIIQNLKRDADWILLFLHWSDELFPYPRPEDRILARELVQIGADIIIGHHPHVVRGMETIDSHPIFYSLGNFFFADIPDGLGGWISQGAPRNHEGLGVLINFCRGNRPEIRLLSFWNTGKQVILDPLRRAIRRVDTVNRPLHRFRNGEYATWYISRRVRFDGWESRWQFGVLRLGIKGTIRRILEKSIFYLRGAYKVKSVDGH